MTLPKKGPGHETKQLDLLSSQILLHEDRNLMIMSVILSEYHKSLQVGKGIITAHDQVKGW